MSGPGRPPVGLDPSGFYCLLFWILVDPLGLLEWNKFQRGSTKSGHPPIMTLACVFLQACPPPDFIWFQSWMTVWLCPLVWLDPLNFIFFSALLIFFGTDCWQNLPSYCSNRMRLVGLIILICIFLWEGAISHLHVPIFVNFPQEI